MLETKMTRRKCSGDTPLSSRVRGGVIGCWHYEVASIGVACHGLGSLLAQVIADQHQLVALCFWEGATALVDTEVGLPAGDVAFLAHCLYHLGKLVFPQGLAIVPVKCGQVDNRFDRQVKRCVLIAHGWRPPLGVLLVVLHGAGLWGMLGGIHPGVRPTSLALGVDVSVVWPHPLQVLQPSLCNPQPDVSPLEGGPMETRAVSKCLSVVQPDKIQQPFGIVPAQQASFAQDKLISKGELHGFVWLVSFSLTPQLYLLLL